MTSYSYSAEDTRACLESDDGEVELLGVKLSGDLRGLLFEAEVEQRFRNPNDTNIEIIYSFPLPWGAVLLGVDVTLGDKRLSGTVVEKKKAAARYENALTEGNAAIMLERNHDQSYSLNLGNLAPKEDCIIKLRYAQTLEFAQQSLRLMIPTLLAPRYGDPVRDGGLMPHQTPEHSLRVEYPFELVVRLHGSLAQSRVASPSHPIAVAFSEGPVLEISLARKAFLDRDFVLNIDQLAQSALAVAAPDSTKEGQVALLASFCPQIPQHATSDAAIKILVDCSGSMGGDSIGAAKRALLAIVNSLAPEERFALSRFGSTVEHRTRGLWKMTDITRNSARRWVEALDADLGGTEMEKALKSTFALSDDRENGQSDVLLITDGEIYAIDAVIAAAKASGHRIFTVGIGSSPAEALLRRMAETSGGACEFIAPGEAVEPAVLRMFGRLRSPRLQQLRLEWPEGTKATWISALPLSVFDGETLNVFALLKEVPSGELRLLGQASNDSSPEPITSLALPRELASGDALARLAAATRIRQLDETQEADARTLALDYQLVTEHTNFLLLHERAEDEKPKDMPELKKIAQMMPAGWGGLGSVHEEAYAEISYCLSESMEILDAGPAEMIIDRLEAPMFSRRASPIASEDAEPSFDKYDPAHWINSDHYTGLSPLGLAEWLRLTPEDEWPSSFEELRDLGLGDWIFDWLEWRLGQLDGDTEEEVVASFLKFMASQEVRAALDSGTAVKPTHTGNKVEEALAKDLQGMTKDAWPEKVLALDL